MKSPPMKSGQVYEVSIDLGYTAYIFPKGHSIRVSVSSAAEPYFVPTSNTGENDMISKPTSLIAQNVVHFAPDHPSQVVLPVVSAEAIPQNPSFNALPPFLSALRVMV